MGWKEVNRGADWSKGLLSPPAMPSVHMRPNLFCLLSILIREYAFKNALCLCVHLVTLHVRSSSILHKGCRQGRNGCKSFGLFLIKKATIKWGLGGAEIWLMIAYFTEAAVMASQLAATTHQGSQSKPGQKQTLPINLVSLDTSLCAVTRAQALNSLQLLCDFAASHVTAMTWKHTEGKAICSVSAWK